MNNSTNLSLFNTIIMNKLAAWGSQFWVDDSGTLNIKTINGWETNGIIHLENSKLSVDENGNFNVKFNEISH